jgi:glycosyltransferase involved in cell wall biosynthesis
MRLLVDVRKLSDKPSGIGYYTYNFLESILEESFEIILVSDVIQSKELNELKDKGVEIICYGKKVDKNIEVIKYFKFIQQVINSSRPDIFWEPNNIVPIKIINPYGKIVVTIHDLFPLTDKKFYGIIYRIYFAYSLKNTIRISDGLIYVSQETKKQVEYRYKRARKIKNFISYNIVKGSYEKSIENVDNNYFLFIGNIEKRKGIDILINAFERYKKEGGERNLYLAGALRDQTILMLIEKLNDSMGDCIKYLGYIDNEEKMQLLAECSAFVFPSKAEGFGIPPIEALKHDKACIVSDINIFKEILGDSVTYFRLSDDDNKSIESLKEKLITYSKPCESKIRSINKKYSKNELSDKLINFFRNEVN